jgi:hypothetical protein
MVSKIFVRQLYALNPHAGLEQASSTYLDSGFRRSDNIGMFNCWSNNTQMIDI